MISYIGEVILLVATPISKDLHPLFLHTQIRQLNLEEPLLHCLYPSPPSKKLARF